MSLPLVSVFVASYNNEKFIVESLNSVMNQTYTNIELIIIDDKSTDSSVRIINDWVSETGYNCKFICNEINMGICAVSNIFLSNANGIYISWLASDDVMLPEKIEKQVEILEKEDLDVGVVYSDALVMNEDSEILYRKFLQMHKPYIDFAPQGNIFYELLEGNFIPIMSALIKRECYEKCGWYDEDLIYEDYDLLLRISRKYKFIFSDYISVQYRVHQNNLTKKLASSEGLRSDFDILIKHVGITSEIDKVIEDKLFFALRGLCDNRSKYFKEKLKTFKIYFRNSEALDIAAKFNMSYQASSRLHRLFLSRLPRFK